MNPLPFSLPTSFSPPHVPTPPLPRLDEVASGLGGGAQQLAQGAAGAVEGAAREVERAVAPIAQAAEHAGRVAGEAAHSFFEHSARPHRADRPAAPAPTDRDGHVVAAAGHYGDAAARALEAGVGAAVVGETTFGIVGVAVPLVSLAAPYGIGVLAFPATLPASLTAGAALGGAAAGTYLLVGSTEALRALGMGTQELGLAILSHAESQAGARARESVRQSARAPLPRPPSRPEQPSHP